MTALFNRLTLLRQIIQWGFLVWILYLGLRFGLFVRYVESGGLGPVAQRPPGVEGFLPIGGLASLKLWLFTGTFDDKHPAALVLLVTFLLMSLLAKKSFCSWLCPVGTLSEFVGKIGKRLFGSNFTMWRWLDIPLRGLKYLLLAFFVKILLIDMSVFAIGDFLKSPYWALSDIKMWYFFIHISSLTLFSLGAIVTLSLLYKSFWCRYLCPYGALLGLLSMLSPFKIRRNVDSCTACQKCTQACPAQLAVHEKISIYNPECFGCLSCVDACPHDSLAMTTSFTRKPLPRWVFPVVVLAIYTGGIMIGMLSGHWDSSLTLADYQQLMLPR
jgi:polyferredoxin